MAYKFTEKKRQAFLDLLAKGHRRGKALEQTGLTRSVLSDWCKDHPEFRDEMEDAELAACDFVEDALWAKCVEGHFAAQEFWLLNRSKGRWQNKRGLIVTHYGDTPFNHQEQQAALLQDGIPDTTTVGANPQA